jgi:hypothetical protein
VLEKVKKLNQAEQLRLLEQIPVLIPSKAMGKTHHSILELQGMGRINKSYSSSTLMHSLWQVSKT